MSYDFQIKQQAAQPALTVRTHAPAQEMPNLFPRVFGMIMQYLAELGEQPAGMPFAGYYNMDTQNMDVEIGFPVGRTLAGKGEIQASEFPGGRLASVMHVGPYDQVSQAYDALAQWVKDQGYEMAGAAYELYYSEPETPPEEIRTEIMFPIK